MKKYFLFCELLLLSHFLLFGEKEIASYIANNEFQESAPYSPLEKDAKPVVILEEPGDRCCPNTENCFEDDYHFMLRYYKTIESSLNRNEKTGKLGKNTIDGKRSGTFSYCCKLNGWNKVIITMIYNDYCDEDFIINGTTIVEVNWMASGTMNGIIYADGPAKAIVEYNLIINESIESDGYYLLCRPENDYIAQVPASVVLKFANRLIELDGNCTAAK